MNRDRYDLPLSTTSVAAAVAYGEGLDGFLSAWTNAGAAFDRAITADPDFALAHIARARVHALYGEGIKAKGLAARARELAAQTTARERGHVDVIAAVIEGQPGKALAGAEQHLDEFPRDALVLSMLLGAFGLYAFSGRNDHDAARVAICERHASHYGEDWWFLTFLGWSHTEAGSAVKGLALSERAIELRRENGHAAHGLSHGLFEQGDTAAGSVFLGDWLPSYDGASFMTGHLYWHLALLALDAGDLDGALKIYLGHLRPSITKAAPMHGFPDSSSLLWRLSLAGCDGLDPHWREVADYGERSFPRAGIPFADIHRGLAVAATRDSEKTDKLFAELTALHADGKLAPGTTAIELCRGIRAFADGDYLGTVQILEPLMTDVVRIGGSHAQRELYEDMLIVACLRASYPAKARGLIDERLHRRPSQRDAAWAKQAG